MVQTKQLRGFTLIELIVVMGIIAILAAIVIVAVNPGRQLAQARQAQRRNDVEQILNAVTQYAADNSGALPNVAQIPTAPTAARPVCDSASGGTCVNGTHVNLGTSFLVPTYLTKIPLDPGGGSLTEGTATNTQYYIQKDANGRVTISAPNASNENPTNVQASITVTR